MLLPRYYFGSDFQQFEKMLLEQCDGIRAFRSGEFLNDPHSRYDTVYYILQGIGRFYIQNAEGVEISITYHGRGTMYPLYRPNETFKMEENLFFQAVSPMRVAAFRHERILDLCMENREFARAHFALFMKHVNLFLYRIANATANDALTTVSNFLFILLYNKGEFVDMHTVHISQDEIAKAVSMSRVHVTRILNILADAGVITLGRKKITVLNFEKLLTYCSDDMIDE